MARNGCLVIGLLFTNVGFPIDKLSDQKCLEPQMIQIVNKAKGRLITGYI